MSPRNQRNPVDDFIKALSDKRVQNLVANIFEGQLKSALQEIEELKRINAQQTETINKLSAELDKQQLRIDGLEAYNRRENLIICGLPVINAAEAATAGGDASGTVEHAAVTEQAVLALCQQQLQVNISASDISVAHRLKKTGSAPGPAPVIVRFTNRKARDAVYAARFALKHHSRSVFINEDLTSHRAHLFAEARKLVTTKKIASAWTSNGDVFIKLSTAPNCKPTRIQKMEDLNSLQ